MSFSYYVGIDQSLTSPGVAVINDRGFVELATSVSVDDKLRGSARLRFIYGALIAALDPYRDVRRTALEGPSLESTHREFDLGEVSGITKLLLIGLNAAEPLVVPPSTLKLFATGNGLAKKDEILHVVKNTFKLDLGTKDDAADAFFLARICWGLDHPTLLRRRCELDALKSLTRKKPPTSRALAKPSL